MHEIIKRVLVLLECLCVVLFEILIDRPLHDLDSTLNENVCGLNEPRTMLLTSKLVELAMLKVKASKAVIYIC
jgi:hypothetical protein